jgi:DNA (cytosine-5)-methyltransferase 1
MTPMSVATFSKSTNKNKKTLKSKGNPTPTVVSLFSGAGGIDLGFKHAGIKIVWAIDNDQDSVETYKKNIGNHAICEDILNVPSDMIPEADVVIGGFPCQGFSLANKYRSTEDTRNTLYLEMLRVIRDKQPKWFIAENVKGILSLGGGKVFERILEDFQTTGYRVVYKLVNMADHGVPQMRKRVVILGTRKDLPESMNAYHPEEDHSQHDNLLRKKWISISEALSELEKYDTFPNNVGSKYKTAFRDFTGHRRSDPNKPSPTILARGNGKGGVCAIPHPNGKRRMTVRESALIQTFPVDFEFVGGINSMYRQIGNAIPVIYGKKLGQMLKEIAKNEEK